MKQNFLLLHGFTGRSESWEQFVRFLPDGAHVLAPALYGHGAPAGLRSASSLRSASEQQRALEGETKVRTFDDEVDRIAALVATEFDSPAHLVGYSLGGRVALGLMVRYPSLFRCATLVGSHLGLDTEEQRAERRSRDEHWARCLEQEGIATFVDCWQDQGLFLSQSSLPDALLREQRIDRLQHEPQDLARALRVLGLGNMPFWRNQLAGVDLPTQLVVGEYDLKFRDVALRMARLMPRATVRVAPWAGHNVLLERPQYLAAVALEAEAVLATASATEQRRRSAPEPHAVMPVLS